MRGDDLLLTHLAILPGVDDDLDDDEPRPSARERLEDEIGPDLVRALLGGDPPPSA